VSGSGISWAICKSGPCSRQITTPAPHHLVFLQARCPSYRPTNSVKALKAPPAHLTEDKIDVKYTVLSAFTHTHRLIALCPGLPGSAGTRKVKPIWILLEQETVGGSGISCTSLQTDNHTSTTPLTGFVANSKYKIQAFFKDFQGPKLRFPSTKIIDKKPHPRRGHEKFRLQSDSEASKVKSNTVSKYW